MIHSVSEKEWDHPQHCRFLLSCFSCQLIRTLKINNIHYSQLQSNNIFIDVLLLNKKYFLSPPYSDHIYNYNNGFLEDTY